MTKTGGTWWKRNGAGPTRRKIMVRLPTRESNVLFRRQHIAPWRKLQHGVLCRTPGPGQRNRAVEAASNLCGTEIGK